MTWFTLLPYPIQWAIVILAGVGIIGTLGLAYYTLIHKGRIRLFGKVELDVDEEKPEDKQ